MDSELFNHVSQSEVWPKYTILSQKKIKKSYLCRSPEILGQPRPRGRKKDLAKGPQSH